MKIKQGFTLIEGIILIVILGIGFMSLTAIYLSAIHRSRLGEEITLAASCAEKIMEEEIRKDFENINSWYNRCSCVDNFADPEVYYNCNLIVTPNYCDADIDPNFKPPEDPNTNPERPCRSILLILTLNPDNKEIVRVHTQVFDPNYSPGVDF